MIISKDANLTFGKAQHPFMAKALKKLEREGLKYVLQGLPHKPHTVSA